MGPWYRRADAKVRVDDVSWWRSIALVVITLVAFPTYWAIRAATFPEVTVRCDRFVMTCEVLQTSWWMGTRVETVPAQAVDFSSGWTGLWGICPKLSVRMTEGEAIPLHPCGRDRHLEREARDRFSRFLRERRENYSEVLEGARVDVIDWGLWAGLLGIQLLFVLRRRTVWIDGKNRRYGASTFALARGPRSWSALETPTILTLSAAGTKPSVQSLFAGGTLLAKGPAWQIQPLQVGISQVFSAITNDQRRVCPVCEDSELASGKQEGSQEWLCRSCGGQAFEGGAAQEVLSHAGTQVDELRRAVRGNSPLSCPACAHLMDEVTVHDGHMNVCFDCGTLWVPLGQMHKVTLGFAADVTGTSLTKLKAGTLGGVWSKNAAFLGVGAAALAQAPNFLQVFSGGGLPILIPLAVAFVGVLSCRVVLSTTPQRHLKTCWKLFGVIPVWWWTFRAPPMVATVSSVHVPKNTKEPWRHLAHLVTAQGVITLYAGPKLEQAKALAQSFSTELRIPFSKTPVVIAG